MLFVSLRIINIMNNTIPNPKPLDELLLLLIFFIYLNIRNPI
jgi:hypothetical protein